MSDLEDLIEDQDNDGFIDDGTDALVDENSSLASVEELASRVRRLVELRNERDADALRAKNSKETFESYQAAFFEEYERSPLKGSINVDLGDDLGEVRIVPKSTKYGRILDRDAAAKYFEERELLDEYLKDDFRMGRLHELVRDHIEKKKPLPPGIDFYTKEYFQITFKD